MRQTTISECRRAKLYYTSGKVHKRMKARIKEEMDADPPLGGWGGDSRHGM